MTGALVLPIIAGSCGSSDFDDLLVVDSTLNSGIDPIPDSIPTIEEDPFVPPTGPIEPLTDYLRPVYSEGKIWKFHHQFPAYTTTHASAYIEEQRFGGDTIVKGANAQKLIRNSDYFPEKDIIEIVREENGRVYTLITNKEIGMDWGYMFSVTAGAADSVCGYANLRAYPLSRGTITLMNKMRRAVKVWVPSDHEWGVGQRYDKYDYWVEGIGMLHYHVPTYSNETTGLPAPYIGYLTECWDGNEKIYDYRELRDELYKPEEIYATESDWPWYYTRMLQQQQGSGK